MMERLQLKVVVFVLFPLAFAACGKDTVTLTLQPSSTTSHSFSKAFSGISSVGFCKQKEFYAGIIENPHTSHSKVINILKVGMKTNFPDWTQLAPNPIQNESVVTTELNQTTAVTYDQPIKLTIPKGSTVDVGMVGILNLGTPDANGFCDLFSSVGTQYEPWRYVTLFGSVPVTSYSNTQVNVPLSVVKKTVKLEYLAGPIMTSPDLISKKSQRSIVTTWFKFASGISVTKLTAILDPAQSNDPNLQVHLPLYQSTTAATTNLPSSPPNNPATPGTTSVGYAIPNLFPMRATYSATVNSVSVTCTMLITENYVTTYHDQGQPDNEFSTMTIDSTDPKWSCF